jgi:hypothetical protein
VETDNGPYETEREAHAAAIAAIPPEDGRSILTETQNRQLLEDACAAAGVTLGEFDRRIIDWFGGFDDSSCAVIAGIIRRAHLAGMEGGRHEIAEVTEMEDGG